MRPRLQETVISSTLATVASIFLLLMVGYGTKKLRILSVKDVGVVNAIVINLALPAFIFTSVHDKPFKPAMAKAPVVGLVMEMLVLGAAYLFARMLKLSRRTTAGLMLAATFGNTGYLGIPFITAAFHKDGASILSAVMMDSFAMRLGLTTVGIAVATCFAGSKFEWKSMLEFVKSPLFPAVIVALIFRTTHVPEFLMNTITAMASATVPLSMLSVGLSLNGSSVRKYPLAYGIAIAMKMALLPLLVFFGLKLFHIEHSVAQIAVVEMAMPTAVFTGVVAGKYGADEEFVAGSICVMTLMSVLILPVVLGLVR